MTFFNLIRLGNPPRVRGLCGAVVIAALLFVGAVDPISARASTSIDAGGQPCGEPPHNNVVDASQPSASIAAFHDALLEVMQNAETWDFATRRDRLAPEIAGRFDARFMARVSAGRYWSDFSEEQRTQLADTFRAFTLANYAARFNGYSGQEFQMAEEQKRDEKRTFVRTRLIKANGEAIRIDYLLQRMGEEGADARWGVIDIFVEGRFSELAVRRSEFAPILRDQGFGGLIEVLQTRIRELEAEGAAGK